jgi:hypothetical protein
VDGGRDACEEKYDSFDRDDSITSFDLEEENVERCRPDDLELEAVFTVPSPSS